jgi:hypothetical protein
LLAVAAFAGAVVLKPSGDVKPDAWSNFPRALPAGRKWICLKIFSAGLDTWESGGGASGWSYDDNGVVNPGALSLSQGLPLTNYDLGCPGPD